MLIDAKEALRLSEMLRISLTSTEADRLADDMSSVLDYVGLLDELNVENVDPMGVGVNEYAELRDDEPWQSFEYEDLEMLGGGAFDPELAAFTVQAVFE